MRSVNTLAKLVLAEVESGNGISTLAEREGGCAALVASIERAASELGWRPREEFESALGETIQWYKHLFMDNE